MKKTVATLLIVSVISAGCAHTTPNPVLLAQPGDESRSCEGIVNEMQQMIAAQTTAEADRNKQIAGNVALGVAGAFLIVPWFFMDTGNAATVEERAAQARYQRLNQMQIDKKCPATSIQATSPSSSDSKSVGASVPHAQTVSTRSEVGVQKAETPSQSLSPAQKMEVLDAMLKKGFITQDEFNAKKLAILSSL